MTELAVSDLAASLAWYRDRLGLREVLRDGPNGFALLEAADGGRLALKVGVSRPGGVKLHFEVADLAGTAARSGAGDVKESPEGYRRAIVSDPDGYAVVLFEWARPPGSPPDHPVHHDQ